MEVEQSYELNSEDKDQESRSRDGLAQSLRGPQVGCISFATEDNVVELAGRSEKINSKHVNRKAKLANV